MKRTLLLLPALTCLAVGADWIPQGTNVVIRTGETIHIRATDGYGRVFPGTTDNDVFDRDGNLLIPRGSNAELIVRRVGPDEVAVDLDSITVRGHRYGVAATETEARGARRPDNGHVGAYTGGGAVLGTILGAVAGGGKGAAIGAAAGAGAGLTAGLETRGRSLNVPVESLLTFRLEQPIRIDTPDRGFERDGYHWHNDGGR